MKEIYTLEMAKKSGYDVMLVNPEIKEIQDMKYVKWSYGKDEDDFFTVYGHCYKPHKEF